MKNFEAVMVMAPRIWKDFRIDRCRRWQAEVVAQRSPCADDAVQVLEVFRPLQGPELDPILFKKRNTSWVLFVFFVQLSDTFCFDFDHFWYMFFEARLWAKREFCKKWNSKMVVRKPPRMSEFNGSDRQKWTVRGVSLRCCCFSLLF